jgi:hypothetical protein
MRDQFATAGRLAVGPLEVIPDDMLVVVAGQRLWLTGRERVWGNAVAGFKDRSVEVYIRRLRVKLAAAAPGWDYIHTHHNIGYRLEPEPREDRP